MRHQFRQSFKEEEEEKEGE